MTRTRASPFPLTYAEQQQAALYGALASAQQRGAGEGMTRRELGEVVGLSARDGHLRDLLAALEARGAVVSVRDHASRNAPVRVWARCCASCSYGEWHEWHRSVNDA